MSKRIKPRKVAPDAISYKKGLIIFDKPSGRPFAKDRQEILLAIEAFKVKTNKLPQTIEIHRYDPFSGETVDVESFKPEYVISL